MLQLNDDCLLHIFRELNIREQLMVAGVCARFRDVIVELLWRSRFRELCTNSGETNTLHADEYQEFFALNVLNLEKLTIMDTRTWAFTSYLGRFYRPELAFYFTFEFPFLVELNCQDPNLHDEHIRLIAKKCANLRVLRVSGDYVTGAYMKDLRQLRQLYVPKCRLRMLHLEAIMRELPLTHLDVTGNSLDYELGVVLSKLSGTSLRELHISENAIDEGIIENYHKLKSLRMLQVTEVSHVINAHWPRLLQAMGARTKALHIENTSSYTSAVNMIATNLSLLCKLEKLYFAPQSDIDYVNAFWQLTTLKELHVVHEKYLKASLPLVSNCPGLEHIYLERRRPMHPDIFNWADRLIQLLQSQATPRPVLNVHITEYAPEKLAQKLIKELDALYPQQSVVKWVWEPMSTPFIRVDQCFVSFDFE